MRSLGLTNGNYLLCEIVFDVFYLLSCLDYLKICCAQRRTDRLNEIHRVLKVT